MTLKSREIEVTIDKTGETHRVYDPDCPCGVKPWRNEDEGAAGWIHSGTETIVVSLYRESKS